FCQFGELTDEFGGHGGVDGRLSGHRGTHGARAVCRPDLLVEVPVGPGLECVEQVGLVLTHREHDDTHLGYCGADTGACLWPGGDRHHHVHEHHVGFGLTGEADGFLPVPGFPHHCDVGLGGEDGHKATSEQGVVVDDKDTDRIGW